MGKNDPRTQPQLKTSDLDKLREEIFGVECCYYCSDEDTGDLVEQLRAYGIAAIPVLIEALTLGLPSPLIAACDILGEMGSASREALPSLLRTLDYSNTFAPYSVSHVIDAADRAIKQIQALESLEEGASA